MAKRKSNISTRKKFKWTSFFDWMPGVFVQSFAWVLLFLFVAGAGMGVREIVYADPALQLSQIKIYPPDAVSMTKLESLQKRYFGQNTAEINLSSIARDLESDHQILKADVRRDLPSRLEIHIERRVPFAYARLGRAGAWTLVSRDAVVLDLVSRPGGDYYLIENLPDLNQKPKVGLRLTHEVLDLARITDALSRHPLAQTEKIERMEILPNDAAILYLKDLYLKVSLNDPNPAQMFNKLQYLLETENRAVVEYVDLRFNRVILKRKTESQESESKKK